MPDDVIQNALDAAKTFLHQPEEIKRRVNQKNCKFRNGWYPPKSNRVSQTESIDHHESFGIRYDPLYDPEVGDVDAIPEEIHRGFRMNDYCWVQTANLPQFKEHVLAYWRSCLSLARRLIRIFALALRLPEDYFDKLTSHPDAAVALNYYPQLPSHTSEDELENVSIGSHTDLQCFTMLWQDQNGGLQLLNRDGEWINAAPIEGTLVVNIGDYMMRITNDRFISTVHRAKNVKPCERYSMPFFFGMYCGLSERMKGDPYPYGQSEFRDLLIIYSTGFIFNETCGVLPSCIDDVHPAKYEPISCAEWVRLRFKKTTLDV